MTLKNLINIVLLLFVLNVQTVVAQIAPIESKEQQDKLTAYADSFFLLGNYYFIDNQDSSRIAYSRALEYYVSQNNMRKQMLCFSRLSALYDNLGNTDTALVLAYRAVSIGVSNGYDTTLAETYLRLGVMYKEIGEFEKSKEFFYKVIDKGFPNTMNGAWGGLGILYSNIEEYDSARFYIEKSIQYFEAQNANSHVVLFNLASLYGSMGINCFDMDKPMEGLRYFEKSLQISRQIGNQTNIVSNLLNLSIAYDMSGLSSKSEGVLEEAFEIADSLGNQKLKTRVFLLMSDHYYEIKDFELAYNYLNRYHLLKDSLRKLDYQKSLHKSELNYLQQIQEIDLERVELEKEKNQLRFIIIIGVSSLLFIFITLYLFRKVNVRTKEKKKFERKSKHLGKRLEEAIKQLQDFDQKLEKQNSLILQLQEDSEDPENEDRKEIIKELENRKIILNEDWVKYMETFNILHPKFMKGVLQNHSNLTEGDKRQLIMIKLEYSRKKTALILGISPDSVKRAQQRLSRKLNLKDITELKSFVESF